MASPIYDVKSRASVGHMGCFADLTMASTSRRRQCSNDPNVFCYICGNFTVKTQRRNVTDFVKRVYFAYFKVKLGDQDKDWAPHKVCKTCIESLRSWSQGKNAKLPFGVPMVWREPSNHLSDCYFCLVDVKGFNKKNKQYLQYPSIPSAIRPVAHSGDIPVPKFTALTENVDTDLSSHCYIDEEDRPDIFQPCDEDCDEPILFTQSALNDLVRDLYLPKESAELLASRLQENRMLKPGTSVSFYRNREEELHTPRSCINRADRFCYICGEVTFASQRRNLTAMIRKAYKLYFGCRIGDQDKIWAPHICCNKCASHLTQWLHGKRQAMPFAIPMIWSEPTNHSTNCYFCMVSPIRKGISKKKKWTLQYPDLPSAIRPVPHTKQLPVPKAPETFSVELSEEEEGAWCHEASSSHDPDFPSATSPEPHLITQRDLNDLIRDLDLSKSKGELLGSWLQQWDLLAVR